MSDDIYYRKARRLEKELATLVHAAKEAITEFEALASFESSAGAAKGLQFCADDLRAALPDAP